jgi:hypothetical protein
VHWEQTPTGHRCPGHGLEFARGHACPVCVANPGSAVETKFVSDEARRLAISAARKMARSDAWHVLAEKAAAKDELGHAAKLGTLSLQYERAADEQIAAAYAEQKDHDLLDHDNKMAGLGGVH